MNAAIHAESDFIVGVYPRVDSCGIGVVISFEGSGGGKPALINVELTNYAAIQLAKKLVAAAEQHAKDTNKSVEYFRRQLNRKKT
jgi:hypothetical protein